jgi:hypothetical protein
VKSTKKPGPDVEVIQAAGAPVDLQAWAARFAALLIRLDERGELVCNEPSEVILQAPRLVS